MTPGKAFLCAMLALVPAPAIADARSEVRGASLRCDGLAEDRAWLDCYYGAAQPMRGQLGLPPAPAAQQRLVPPSRTGSADGDGERIVSRMTSRNYDSGGSVTVFLANGEVWRQLSGDPHIARWKETAAMVTIAPGPLGSYDMRVEGDRRVYKVRLIR
jgi:hypothetical protein